ncbi:MAG: hypothetical protein AAGG53_00930 [Cyanobacteria bacterium P01_H01_bin.152]
MLKETLAQLKGEQTDYAVALQYALLKDGERPKRPDKYLRTVQRILENPETAEFQNLARLFELFGVDIRAAVAIAASQAKPK